MSRREKNLATIRSLYEDFTNASQICLVTLENVGSRQVQLIRRDLATKGAKLIIGKNTLIRMILDMRIKDLTPKSIDYDYLKQFGTTGMPQFQALRDALKGKLAMVISDAPVFELMPIIESNRVDTVAKVGVVSPVGVVVPAGPTGMDPSQISFFHALKITTKINKGQIEILKDVQVLVEGQTVQGSEASFLAKMGLKPFKYGMDLHSVYADGQILDKQVAKITPDDLVKAFQAGCQNLTAISMETGLLTAPAVPQFLVKAFKNVLAVSMESGYKLDALEAALNAAATTTTSNAGAAGGKTEAKAAEPEPEPEEEDMDMGDLFG